MAKNKFSETALKILEKRYYLKDKDNNLLEKTPEELFRRVANFIATAEDNYENGDKQKYSDIFYEVMVNKDFMPASPVLFNAGTKNPMLSSCFSLPIEDDMSSILKSLSDGSIIFKYGGGVGWNFSKLREENAPLSSGGTSSGVCSFITLFDTMIETIKQGGKRRGAGAAILDAYHKDIKKFISMKKDHKKWNNINISVICTDIFMDNLFKGGEYETEIWGLVSKSNWDMGDPNIIFIDTMNKFNTLPHRPIDNVNPCHEICMTSYESCNLGGINLNSILKGKKSNEKIDWDKLGKLIKIGHRFLDNMIDVCKYPLPEIDHIAKLTRRQGLYFFGLAPFLIRLGLRYGSQESLDLIDNLFCFINRVSLETCIELGKERGNFPEFEKSTYYNKYKYMRCSNRLTIAPSGTTSRISDSYFSIEPYYSFEYQSNIMDEVIEEKFDIKEDYKDIFPHALVTAHDLTPEEHLRVMAAVSKWVDQSVSKTVNVPYEASVEEVGNIFKLAYKMGIKAVSIYRTGSRDTQVLSEKKVVKKGRRFEISKDYLEDLYLNKKYSQSQISEILGVSRTVVCVRLKEYGIETRTRGENKRFIMKPSVEMIKFLKSKGLNYDEIAFVYDHKRYFIDDMLREVELEESNHFINRSIPISPLLVEFIEGELLGDGHIREVGNCKNTNMAYYSHSSKYYEYLEWLDYLFSSEGLYKSGNIQKDITEFENGSKATVYRYSTIACIELYKLWKKWYIDRIKTVPNSLSFTPTMVRQWFIGDGVVKSDGAIYFCTQCFDEESINILRREFKEKIGIEDITLTKRNEMYIKKRFVDSLYSYMEQSYYEDAPCYDYKFHNPECPSGACEI